MIDLHLHTTASDGLLPPAALVDAARAAGLRTIAITDHDTTAGIAEAVRAAEACGLDCVRGIEITAIDDERDIHVLGYFIDPEVDAIVDLLTRQQRDRLRRLRGMADRLAALGMPIDMSSILEDAARGRTIGRPHLADALIRAGHVRSRHDAFEQWLARGRPAFLSRAGAAPAEVIDIIHAAGGVASLAHPGLNERDDLIPALARAGLDALEARHSQHDENTERHYRRLAADHGLLVSGGSDFHGDPGDTEAALGVVTLPAADFEALRQRAGRPRP
ncbi:MAG TPA: PHP domain-containing protein [Vicinamibacterales bacterium]|nr:PHP domain-containing protein [Vicinamibacterales bacterium]